MAESFGIVNLEAMASGIPIVASDLGGIPDVVNDRVNGLLSIPGDIQNLAETLALLMADAHLRKELGDNGKKLAGNYSWDKIANETEQLYMDILNGTDISGLLMNKDP
jgi:glycosyltransferase involved in cell wall biosynthesis